MRCCKQAGWVHLGLCALSDTCILCGVHHVPCCAVLCWATGMQVHSADESGRPAICI